MRAQLGQYNQWKTEKSKEEMTEYSKLNMVYRLQKWMDSVPGQTFLNYAYSWGAAVVILGTLFKLTHLPGANFMLFLGMGTEVVVFFLSAFDRPFDKTADGRDLPTHVADEDGFDEELSGEEQAAGVTVAPHVVGGGTGGGTIIIGGGGGSAIPAAASGGEISFAEGEEQGVAEGEPSAAPAAVAALGGGSWVAGQQSTTPGMAEAQANYVDALNNLTEMLSKVSEQSLRLTRDSEEMENLNRTLTGICKVYEMQLKGASAQIGTIDQINEQSRRMASQIAELNKIYTRMIEAMTVNMPAAATGLAMKGGNE